MTMQAYVETVYSLTPKRTGAGFDRDRAVAYEVRRDGATMHRFDIDEKCSAMIALHMANAMRDNINQEAAL